MTLKYFKSVIGLKVSDSLYLLKMDKYVYFLVIIIIIISLFKGDNILSNTITYLTYGPL